MLFLMKHTKLWDRVVDQWEEDMMDKLVGVYFKS